MSAGDDPGEDNIPEEFILPIEDHIDLHAFRPREVRSVVESYLDAAYEAGFEEVRIIHGKGIGVQREMVRAVLEKHPFVREFSDAGHGRGSWGATVVILGEPDR